MTAKINALQKLRQIDEYMKSNLEYKMSGEELQMLLYIFGYQMQAQNIPQSVIDEYTNAAYRGAAYRLTYNQ